MEQITVKYLKSLDDVNNSMADILKEQSEKGNICFNVHIEQEGTEYELTLGFYNSSTE